MRPCMECGVMTALLHHVVPVSMGGKQTVPLCQRCHSLAHGVLSEIQYSSALIRIGIANARAKGTRIGRPSKLDGALVARVMALRAEGRPYADIASIVGISVGSVHAAVRLVDPAQW